MKKTYTTIDLWKFIFAFAVISLHANPFASLSPTLNWYIESLFTRLAVPFFYVTSGFFISLKLKKYGLGVLKTYRLNLLPKLLFWGSIALLLMFYPSFQTRNSITRTLLYLAKNAIIYPRGSMWFMLALIVSSLLLQYVLKKRLKHRPLLFSL